MHEENINKLAAIGVVGGLGDGRYDPNAQVTRAQMASFLVRAYEYLTGSTLSASRDYFADDTGNVHETNINKAAEAGFTVGAAGGGYAPGASVRRDQMASFIARLLGRLIEVGYANVGGAGQTVLSEDLVVLGMAASQTLSGYDPDSGRVEFTDPPADVMAIGTGAILATEATAVAPDGMLRRVTAVQHTGTVVLSTTQAALTDAVLSGSIELEVAIDGGAASAAGTAQVAAAGIQPFNIGFDHVFGEHDGYEVAGRYSLYTEERTPPPNDGSSVA